jgi:Alcohol dehydrogenase, class IV
MGVADATTADESAAKAMVKEVTRFCKELEIPTLAELGVKKDEFMGKLDKMAEDALDSGSPQNTFRIPTKDQVIEIYKKLF